MSACSFWRSSAAFFCSMRAASSSCSRCLMASADTAAGGAVCAAAGSARPAESKASGRARQTGDRRPLSAASVLKILPRAVCIVSVSRGLRAVIGVAGQNRCGPINLFQEHHADHLVRPGCRAERDHEPSLAAHFRGKSVRAADDENYIRRLVTEAAQMLGKGCAVDALAALVQCNEPVFFREVRRDRGGLLRDSRGGIAGAAFRNFMNLDAAKAELAA